MKKIKSKPQIEVSVSSRTCPLSPRRLNAFVRDVLGEIKKPAYGVNVYVVDSRRMKSLHWKFFRDKSDTDCMSFSQYEGRAVTGEKTLGDVFVSWGQVSRQAAEFGNTPERELLYCIIHGILHLIGYDDMKEAARKKMFKLQDRIFKRLHGHSKN